MLGDYYFALVSGVETIVFYCEDCYKAEDVMDNILERASVQGFKRKCDGCDNCIEGKG